jgi:hypothetical protein
MNEQRRDRGQWGDRGRNDQPPRRPQPRRDAGAYIGRMPERTDRREGATATKDAVPEAGQNR